MANNQTLGLLLALLGTACWGVCFWWMHLISAKQEAMLRELHDVASRIEALSKEEHELIKEVHPVVEKIHETVANVEDAVGSSPATQPH